MYLVKPSPNRRRSVYSIVIYAKSFRHCCSREPRWCGCEGHLLCCQWCIRTSRISGPCYQNPRVMWKLGKRNSTSFDVLIHYLAANHSHETLVKYHWIYSYVMVI
ncbi:hypothetical protein NPIL_225821 [Nephila pilipes]|uniref:Uncharacterized protein n=1 Tax=Nephila pilipes TaxID=299642 RepID=A0A8X6QS25_NEPPI|nr:hypothetical protein NPIL_225821 [Nephila pilipes]